MNHKNLFFILSVFFLLPACDWGYTTEHTVKNSTSREVIIRTPPKSWRPFEIKDSIHYISPREELLIVHAVNLCGRNYYPEDPFRDTDTIPFDCEKFEVWVDNTRLPDRVRLRKYWTFSSKKYWCGYLLEVNEELLELLERDEIQEMD